MQFKLKLLTIIACTMLVYSAQGQTEEPAPSVTFSGYLDTYFSYDFGQPFNHTRPGFLYSYNRHNEVNINLAYLKGAYSAARVRGNLAMMTGTYAIANLAAEPGVLQHVLEANTGVKLSKTKEVWLDAGIFPSHIGFESAISKDCWNLTRGILAENSPYFESGVKIGYTTDDGKWFFSALLLNGWQRIQRPSGNQTPAIGHQITFKPNDKVTLNSSSFIGNDKPDLVSQTRYFHNFYGIFQFNDKLGLTLGFDLGAEQAAHDSRDYNVWYTPVAMVRASLSDRVQLCLRGEYYADPEGVIIATGTENGFQTLGVSANLDVAVTNNVLWRVELRSLNSRDEIFFDSDQKPSKNNTALTTSLAISF